MFNNAGPFSSYYGSNTASTLPAAYGTKIPYAVKGYTGKQLRAAYGAGTSTGKGVRGRHHRRVRLADHRVRRGHLRQEAR